MKHTIELIRAIADKYDLQWCDNYGEPGYSLDCGEDGKENNGIILGNWNDVPEHVTKWIEKRYNIEWCDEWYIDYNRSKCYRTSADSYFWTPSVIFHIGDEPFTIDDAEDDPDTYLEFLIDNPSAANIFNMDITEHGFEKINQDEFENGWFGVEDSPAKILKELQEKMPEHEFIFSDFSNEQFRSNFNIYGRKKINNEDDE